jgi:hypothetical protein
MTVQAATAWRDMALMAESYPYRDELFTLADTFRDHAAVAQWQRLMEAYFMYDAPVAFALHHSDPPALMPQAPYPPMLVARAGSNGEGELTAWTDALRAFARDTGFQDVMERWRPFHAQLVTAAQPLVDDQWVSTLASYAGMEVAPVQIILAPLSAMATGYGGDGGFVVLGPQMMDGESRPVFNVGESLRAGIWHESAHAFVRRSSEAHDAAIKALEPLFSGIPEHLRYGGYSTWRIALEEEMVRAVVARLSPNPEDVAAHEAGLGFVHVPALTEALFEYDRARDRYPTWDRFVPRLLEALGHLPS